MLVVQLLVALGGACGEGDAEPTALDAMAGDAGDPACNRGTWNDDFYVGGAGTAEELTGYTAVTGSLDLVFVDLPSLEGLECLREVGGLSISGAHALRSLEGLEGLRSVGQLSIGNNAVLASLNGLGGLTSVQEDVYLMGNEALAELDGLGALESIGRSLSVGAARAGCCEPAGPPPGTALTSLHGLSALRSIGGDLILSSNAALRTLDGIASLTDLAGDLSVMDNSALPTCEATALADRLVAQGWAGQTAISGNDDAGGCE